MNDLSEALGAAWMLIWQLDPDFVEIVALSLKVSLSAVFIGALIGLPLGAALALFRFPGRRLLVILINALMGLPPVVVGLFLYLLLSRAGPLGVFGLLYSPTAMIIAQVLLVTPIIAAATRQIVADDWQEYREQLSSMGVKPGHAVPTLLFDARYSLLTGLLAGFGRAAGEVGAVMIVGGNIDHLTRVMTTAIALEISRGDTALALGLGLVLLVLSLLINATAFFINDHLAARHV